MRHAPEEAAMKVLEVLRSECIETPLAPADKSAALREVAAAAKRSAVLKDVKEEDILEGLERREALGSTGFGNGIAIPHCRLPSVKEFTVGLLGIPEGVDFESLDDEKVRLIVFIVAPDTVSDAHVRLLSGISQALMVPGAVDEMVAAKSPEALRESFLRHIRDEVDTSDQAGRDLFHVFVQDEDLFRDILQVFGGMEGSAAVVVETENTSAYLSKLPLFAGFWTDHPSGFCRLIVAVVNKSMTNETIRRIERITGGPDKCSEVLVSVQDLFYCAGSLKA